MDYEVRREERGTTRGGNNFCTGLTLLDYYSYGSNRHNQRRTGDGWIWPTQDSPLHSSVCRRWWWLAAPRSPPCRPWRCVRRSWRGWRRWGPTPRLSSHWWSCWGLQCPARADLQHHHHQHLSHFCTQNLEIGNWNLPTCLSVIPWSGELNWLFRDSSIRIPDNVSVDADSCCSSIWSVIWNLQIKRIQLDVLRGQDHGLMSYNYQLKVQGHLRLCLSLFLSPPTRLLFNIWLCFSTVLKFTVQGWQFNLVKIHFNYPTVSAKFQYSTAVKLNFFFEILNLYCTKSVRHP